MGQSDWFRRDIIAARGIAWFFENHRKVDTFILAPGGGFFKDDTSGTTKALQQVVNLRKAHVIDDTMTVRRLNRHDYNAGNYSYLHH